MSAFCVYGVSLAHCVKVAEKKVRSYDKELKRDLTQEEWKERVYTLALEMFEHSARPRQISPAFDAPQFANDWIEVAKRTAKIHSQKLMRRGEKKDKKGNPVVRKGSPVIGWIPYAA